MGYSQNPDVIISQQQQLIKKQNEILTLKDQLIDKQDEILTLRDQFIEQQQEKQQALLSMCRTYKATINSIMSYAKTIKEPGLYPLIEESLKQGKIIEKS